MEGTAAAFNEHLDMRAVDRLDEATRHLQADMEAEAAALLAAKTTDDYQRYLSRIYGFISPLERCLLDTPGLEPFLDHRRLRKHLLIEHDLQTLGMKAVELMSIPQCMWIPWFEDACTALGWAYIFEKNTLSHPNLFRHLATILPGEAAFAATFLKVYASATGEMWTSFGEGLELASSSLRNRELMVEGALTGYRFFRRWRNTLDGKSVSSPPREIRDPSLSPELAMFTSTSVPEES